MNAVGINKLMSFTSLPSFLENNIIQKFNFFVCVLFARCEVFCGLTLCLSVDSFCLFIYLFTCSK